MHFLKPASTVDQQIALLISRGLAIPDRGRASRWLNRVSYYRMSAYFAHFRQPDSENFRGGTCFEQVVALYKFDGRLRMLLLQSTQRIEIAVRTAVTYKIALNYGPFGHLNRDNFATSFDHDKFMDELSEEEKRSDEKFVKVYRKKCPLELHLPVWMATELISFGALSRLYKGLNPDIQREIAATFGVQGDILKNWLHCICYIRNNCAHHKTTWDREMTIKPVIPNRWPYSCVTNR
jgi:abortive infection bacteriophage resistance protein